jgi:hypothetical protein
MVTGLTRAMAAEPVTAPIERAILPPPTGTVYVESGAFVTVTPTRTISGTWVRNAGVTLYVESGTVFITGAPAGFRDDFGRNAHFWVLEARGYSNSFPADIRGDNIKIGIPYATLFKAYEYGDPAGSRKFGTQNETRSGSDVSLGKEIGLIGFESGLAVPSDRQTGVCALPEGPWRTDIQTRLRDGFPGASFCGVGLWAFLSWHMLWDLLAPSAPIVNNDYRFGAALKGMWQPLDWLAVRGNFKGGHESSHLGDELTLANEANPDFMRVNMSYLFWDASLGLSFSLGNNSSAKVKRLSSLLLAAPLALRHWLNFSDPGDRVTVDIKVGTVILNDSNHQGYYQYALSETQDHTLRLSKDTNETYIQGNVTEARNGSKMFASAELRRRLVFRYLPPEDTSPEKHEYSANIMIGVKDMRDPLVSQLASIYVRYYRGVNPNGQFRNQQKFWLLGLGMSVDM